MYLGPRQMVANVLTLFPYLLFLVCIFLTCYFAYSFHFQKFFNLCCRLFPLYYVRVPHSLCSGFGVLGYYVTLASQ